MCIRDSVRIVPIELAVPAAGDGGLLADEISSLLSAHGVDQDESQILDWRYTGQEFEVQAGSDVEEGEVFTLPRKRVEHFS